MSWLLLSAVFAASPTTLPITPIAVPSDTEEHYKAWLKQQGKEVQELVCLTAVPEVATICFKVDEDGVRRFVIEDDLKQWSTSSQMMNEEIGLKLQKKIDAELSQSTVRGFSDKQYWSWSSTTTWPSAVLLHPELVSDRMGVSKIMIALPTTQVLLAWQAGNDELDMVMAVAVAEIFEAEDGFNAAVFQYSSGKLTPAFSAVKGGE